MSRKRDKPYPSRHDFNSLPKRRRPLPPAPPIATADEGGDDRLDKRSSPPPAVVVMGLSSNCSVLDLKSRFEIYGSISRIRIDRDGVGHITFRSKDFAESAIAAALDPSFGITLDSKRVQVLSASDPLCQWRKGVGHDGNKDNGSSSKLLRAEAPLSRHGRGNKLSSSTVSPRSTNTSGLDVPYKGREIIAYDDIL
ncbi:hypothetical protein L1049_005597 [Liquidambar formosana]|uniref:RRM domain-containing protein n=1 Tax=Liquidambar formosana TaxID=63359 RepID=A0AAP0RE05_LIQFO